MIANNRNPLYHRTLNPVYNHSINPIYNHSLNPIYNHSINPIYNHSINPVYNHAINPTYNHSVNPTYNRNICLKYNKDINPTYNNSIPGLYVFDKQNQLIEFTIQASENYILIYDWITREQRKYGVKNPKEGYTIFSIKRNVIGHYVKDSNEGFVVFENTLVGLETQIKTTHNNISYGKQ